jgi:tRNA U55 pseudouridine synthase TruB
MQTPPVKSRVKRQEREREIKSFILRAQKGKDIIFQTEVQGGTYIRKLISDLGEYMGIGMHMIQLRRTRAGIFRIENSIPLKDIEDLNEEQLKEKIIPAEIVSEVYPSVQINDNDFKHIMTGKPIHKKDLIKAEKFEKGQIICAFLKEQFIGMYKVSNTGDIFAMPEFVLQSINKK